MTTDVFHSSLLATGASTRVSAAGLARSALLSGGLSLRCGGTAGSVS